MRRVAVVLLALALLVALACAEPVTRFPGRSWDRARPNSHGFDEAKLKDAIDYPFSLPLSKTYCVSVHRNGVLIADKYEEGRRESDPVIAWSVSKAVMISVIGILERQGRLSRTDRIARYVPEFRDIPDARDITLDHVLRMSSGREYSLIGDFVVPQFLGSQLNYSLGLKQEHMPGTVDQYNQMAFQLLQRVFATVVPDQSLNAWFQRNVMQPMQWESRSSWQESTFFLNVPHDGPLVYGGLHTSCHDLARFGQLWLHKGRWRDTQVLTQEFWTDGLRRATPPEVGRMYHWGGGPNHRATGMGGQFVTFNREKDLVITRIGDPIGLGWQPSAFIDRVMQSLTDGAGSWNSAQDVLENQIPEPEQQISRVMAELGGEENFRRALQEQPDRLKSLLKKQA